MGDFGGVGGSGNGAPGHLPCDVLDAVAAIDRFCLEIGEEAEGEVLAAEVVEILLMER